MPAGGGAGSQGGAGGISATPQGGLAGMSGAGSASGGAAAEVVRGHGPGKIYEVTLEAAAAPVKSGRFSLYVPEGVPKLLGVIVHQHGCGRGGFDVPHDLHWQALANRWGMALMGTEFPTLFSDGDHCDRWSHIENGSSDLLIQALARFGQDAAHPELNTVPWALWGHSGGATWAFQMGKRYPERTLAVVLKSICEDDPAFDQALLGIPTLLATGPLDLGQCYPTTRSIFESYRAKGAPWTYVDEPEGTHETRKLRLLAIPYLDAIIALRLDPAQPSALRAVPDNAGFLANNQTHEVAPAASFAGDRLLASYLPTARLGDLWREFATTRSVTDSSPPEQAPSGLSLVKGQGQVTLKWSVDADLESGLLAFNLYRDGVLWTRLPAGQGAFQGWNYGDEPEPVRPLMSAQDDTPGQSYRISFINGAGLESPLSAAVAPQ